VRWLSLELVVSGSLLQCCYVELSDHWLVRFELSRDVRELQSVLELVRELHSNRLLS
jgi:hypothetical protein